MSDRPSKRPSKRPSAKPPRSVVPTRKISSHFANAARELAQTPAAGAPLTGKRAALVRAWQKLLEVEADPHTDPNLRKLAEALRVLLGPTHGP